MQCALVVAARQPLRIRAENQVVQTEALGGRVQGQQQTPGGSMPKVQFAISSGESERAPAWRPRQQTRRAALPPASSDPR